MPERFESDVFWREDVKLMKDAFCVAWLKVKLIDQDRELTRRLLASAIIDQVNSGFESRDEIVAAAVATLGGCWGLAEVAGAEDGESTVLSGRARRYVAQTPARDIE
jgi:hypothetical protein